MWKVGWKVELGGSWVVWQKLGGIKFEGERMDFVSGLVIYLMMTFMDCWCIFWNLGLIIRVEKCNLRAEGEIDWLCVSGKINC